MENNLKVTLWGNEVGRLSWDNRRRRAVFSYSDDFLSGNIDIAPLTASIHDERSRLPLYGLKYDDIFNGLPAFISDSLPGRWGNTVFSAWAAEHEIPERELTPVDKLSFMGKRAMGALEFEPAQAVGTGMDIRLDDLYRKAMEILEQREEVVASGDDLSLDTLYEVGTSAGGQHTKAVIAMNPETKEIRSGQIMLPPNYKYYILKFAEKDYYPLTVVEYVYSRMAQLAGINMMPCELIEVSGERHFLTERFDRVNGRKVHAQTLAAMNPDAHSYEDLMMVCEDLQLPYKEKEETYRRLVFNILTTNVDAHIRNFSFMLEQGGSWHITPAYDLTFSCFNPHNRFDPDHYLKVRGKTSGITKEDLIAFGRYFSIKHPAEIISQVTEAVKQFRPLAQESKVESYWIDKIEEHFAEMSPDMLFSLEGYKPSVYEFHLEKEDIWVKDAHWTEMGNGAMRLTALLNDKPFRATFPQKSEKTKEIWKLGGTKMKMDDMKQYVLKYFVSKFKEDNSNA
jgi:serine/threonine-protein kinase HipA